MTTHLVIPDSHATPEWNNNRADWLSKFIADVKPEVVVNIGDQWDMASLSSYDKGTKAFIGRNYAEDINVGCEFDDRLWGPLRKKKKRMPKRFFFIGNHEHRIHKVINESPHLEGQDHGVSMSDLQLDRYYDVVVPYSGGTPGTATIDGVTYAHYFTSGVMGRPIGGEHPAYTLLTKNFQTCVQGHTHTIDFCSRTTACGQRVNGLVVGCYQDYTNAWAGEVGKMWWRGVVVLREVENGNFCPSFYSIDTLEREYGH